MLNTEGRSKPSSNKAAGERDPEAYFFFTHPPQRAETRFYPERYVEGAVEPRTHSGESARLGALR